MEHNCIINKYDECDWHLGDGNMPEKMMGASVNDWTPYFHFMERQLIDFETDCCVIFSAQEIVDAEIDYLISVGKISQSTIDWFTSLGYMDSASDDGKPHFHSSPRYWSVLTGNGQNGNALQDPWNVARKYGCIPWTDLPFDSTITTPEQYFAPIPQNLLDKGQQFLLGVGGKNWIQFHWVYENFNAVLPSASVDSARYKTPLHIGVNVGTNWNQVEPSVPVVGSPAGHSISNIADAPNGESCLDHYQPFIKTLVNGYPIPEIMQAVVTITPPPPAPPAPVPTPATPTSPAQPVTVQEYSNWLTAILKWLSGILSTIQGAKGRKKSQ